MTAYQAYRGNQVEGASPLGLILLTYQVLLKSLAQAKYAAENSNFEGEANGINRAMEALTELVTSLDFEQGGEIAKNLGSLYSFMMNHLLQGMTGDTIKAISEVQQIAQTLSDGWHELSERENIPQLEAA